MRSSRLPTSWSPWTNVPAIFRATAILATLLAGLQAAGAQEKPPCDRFAWSVDLEKEWFSKPLEAIRSEGSLPQLADRAFLVDLVPAAMIAYAQPPPAPPREDRPNGAIIDIREVPVSGPLSGHAFGRGVDRPDPGRRLSSIGRP